MRVTDADAGKSGFNGASRVVVHHTMRYSIQRLILELCTWGSDALNSHGHLFVQPDTGEPFALRGGRNTMGAYVEYLFAEYGSRAVAGESARMFHKVHSMQCRFFFVTWAELQPLARLPPENAEAHRAVLARAMTTSVAKWMSIYTQRLDTIRRQRAAMQLLDTTCHRANNGNETDGDDDECYSSSSSSSSECSASCSDDGRSSTPR